MYIILSVSYNMQITIFNKPIKNYFKLIVANVLQVNIFALSMKN